MVVSVDACPRTSPMRLSGLPPASIPTGQRVTQQVEPAASFPLIELDALQGLPHDRRTCSRQSNAWKRSRRRSHGTQAAASREQQDRVAATDDRRGAIDAVQKAGHLVLGEGIAEATLLELTGRRHGRTEVAGKQRLHRGPRKKPCSVVTSVWRVATACVSSPIRKS